MQQRLFDIERYGDTRPYNPAPTDYYRRLDEGFGGEIPDSYLREVIITDRWRETSVQIPGFLGDDSQLDMSPSQLNKYRDYCQTYIEYLLGEQKDVIAAMPLRTRKVLEARFVLSAYPDDTETAEFIEKSGDNARTPVYLKESLFQKLLFEALELGEDDMKDVLLYISRAVEYHAKTVLDDTVDRYGSTYMRYAMVLHALSDGDDPDLEQFRISWQHNPAAGSEVMNAYENEIYRKRYRRAEIVLKQLRIPEVMAFESAWMLYFGNSFGWDMRNNEHAGKTFTFNDIKKRYKELLTDHELLKVMVRREIEELERFIDENPSLSPDDLERAQLLIKKLQELNEDLSSQ